MVRQWKSSVDCTWALDEGGAVLFCAVAGTRSEDDNQLGPALRLEKELKKREKIKVEGSRRIRKEGQAFGSKPGSKEIAGARRENEESAKEMVWSSVCFGLKNVLE